MTAQLSLLDVIDAPVLAPPSELGPCFTGRECAPGETGEGWPGPHHCHLCAAAVDEAARWCDAEIAAGRYDEHLYTPAEARAAKKRGTYWAWATEA